MRQGVESVSVTDFSDSHFGVLQVFQDSFPFLFQYPFVYGHTIEVFEKAAESSGRISSQMRKFFHVLHVAVILQMCIRDRTKTVTLPDNAKWTLGQNVLYVLTLPAGASNVGIDTNVSNWNSTSEDAETAK